MYMIMYNVPVHTSDIKKSWAPVSGFPDAGQLVNAEDRGGVM